MQSGKLQFHGSQGFAAEREKDVSGINWGWERIYVGSMVGGAKRGDKRAAEGAYVRKERNALREAPYKADPGIISSPVSDR